MRRAGPEALRALADASLRLRRIGGALKILGMSRVAGDLIDIASALEQLSEEHPVTEATWVCKAASAP
jgi:hypothetical protein